MPLAAKILVNFIAGLWLIFAMLYALLWFSGWLCAVGAVLDLAIKSSHSSVEYEVHTIAVFIVIYVLGKPVWWLTKGACSLLGIPPPPE